MSTNESPVTLSIIAASANKLESNIEEGNNVKTTIANSDDSSERAFIPQRPMITRPLMQNVGTNAERQPLAETTVQALSHPRTVAVRKNNPSDHVRTSGRAQRIRGKFSDSRRQEVRSIRKKGACIRCRMLRKTVYFQRVFDKNAPNSLVPV